MTQPRLLIVAGPNGSGKSSMVSGSGIEKNYGENIINPDNYARGLSDIGDYTERYLFAMEQCGLLRKGLLERRVSFGFETVASTQEKLDFIKEAAAKGYRIEVVFVSLESAELCCRRIRERVERGGHDVERSKVFSRYQRTMDLLKEYIRVADDISVFDNSGKNPVLVFSKKEGKMRILKRPSDIPWVDRYILPYYKDAERTL